MERVTHADKAPFAAIRRVVFERRCVVRCAAAIIIGSSLLGVSGAPARSAQAVVVDVNTVAQGYRLTKLLGKPVVNDMNQTVGNLDDIIVAKDNQQLFGVLQVGSFLGIGGHLVAVPYTSLMIAADASKIVLPGATKDQLTKLPEFSYRQP